MKVLIVCYSLTGETRKAAEAVAEELRSRADVVAREIIDTKKRTGVFGWLGAARDAFRGRTTIIQAPKVDVTEYDVVAIGTPVWAWSLSPPVRTFLMDVGEKIARPAFFCTMKGMGARRAFGSMEELCGKPPVSRLVLTRKELEDAETVGTKAREFAEALDRAARGESA